MLIIVIIIIIITNFKIAVHHRLCGLHKLRARIKSN